MHSRALDAHAPSATLRVAAPAAIGPWALGFAVIAYAGLKGGAFDVVVRGQLAVAVWWVVALGVGLGVLRARPSRAHVVVGTALAAFAAWSFVSSAWAESSERAVSEAARDLTVLSVFVLGVVSVARERVSLLLGGVLSGIVVIAGVALLSRLQPTWFDDIDIARYLPSVGSRLSYPLNYWNALGALMAMGAPLALALAMTARRVPFRAAALMSVPLLVLVGYLTVSRGAALCAATALLVMFVCTDDRLRWLGHAALAALGGVLLVLAAAQRDDIRTGLRTQLADQQAGELLAATLVVCAGVGLVAAGALWLTRTVALPRLPKASPRTAGLTALAAIAVAGVVAVAAGAPGELQDRWEQFKDPGVGTAVATPGTDRFTSASGAGRYQYWEGVLEAFSDNPFEGVGAGSFATYWARNGTLPGSVQNAHSLYFEVLGELGLVGILLLGGLLGTLLVVGVHRTLRAEHERALFAGALGSCVAFMLSAAIDWSWQVTVLPMTLALLAVALLARPREARTDVADTGFPIRRFAVPGLALASIALVLPSMTAGGKLQDSRAAATSNHLPEALRDALGAERVQPYAQTPLLQQALVLEQQGDLNGAAALASRAARKEPTNWQGLFVLARIETLRGNVPAALNAYRRAKRLNRTASFLR